MVVFSTILLLLKNNEFFSGRNEMFIKLSEQTTGTCAIENKQKSIGKQLTID